MRGNLHTLAPIAAVALSLSAAAPVARVQPNDNRVPAGRMRAGALVLRLEARVAIWHPDGDHAPGAPMPAFAEEGRAARIPGPLIRVPAGTAVEVSVRNGLADTLLVHGLHSRIREGEAGVKPLVVAPGERRSVTFNLGVPGTYYYWGTTMRRGLDYRTLEDAQLTGAIVVDEPGVRRPRDRVFVIGSWTDTVHRARTHRRRILGVINGRSWPNTERLAHAVGDTVQWRVINASADLHPMHLHGFFFRVDSRGDGRGDTTYAAGQAGMAVTESMVIGATMRITWIPERAGNWLFHCHVPEHIGPRGPLGAERHGPAAHDDHAKDAMSGLVLGIAVRERRGASRAEDGTPATVRRMRLLVRPRGGDTGGAPRYEYALHERGDESGAVTANGTGATLDLVRGRPVAITIVNRLREPTAVHWHGIELESYFDGVPGFSGMGRRVTPLIAPGDSFEVRFTPPRAGTFIYHTHANEVQQQLAGLAGPIVVRDGDAPRDTTVDIPILVTESPDSAARTRGVLVNGSASPAPLELRAGTTYRLRFIQIAVTRSATRFELFDGADFTTWRPLAKDGADLPGPRRGPVPSRTRLGIGETFDVELTPQAAGDLRLELRGGLAWPATGPLLGTLPIRVTAGAP